jgi:chromosomal replication initiator protein
MQKHKSFADFVAAPENREALFAVQDVAAAVSAGPVGHLPSPIFLHGTSGTGKSHLMASLICEITRRHTSLVVNVLECGSLSRRDFGRESPAAADGPLGDAGDCDLLIIEDLQYFPPCWREVLVQVLDYRRAHGKLVVVTACAGPQHLAYRGERFSNRLANRLAAGLVVGLQPLQMRGRRLLLECQARQRQLTLSAEVLSWLAEHLTGGGRQLEGALNQLEQLARQDRRPLDIDTVAQHLRDLAEAGSPTMERISLRVSGYFRVEARLLQSRRRWRNVLLPRQVGMYLARQLTGLSLEQIGAYFGGRDHSTVLHACRKVAQGVDDDAVLSGAVRQIRADIA